MRQAVRARRGNPPASSDDLWRHLLDHRWPVHSPTGRFHSGGIDAALWDLLVIYLFAVGGLGFSVLFGMWQAAVIHTLFVILTLK